MSVRAFSVHRHIATSVVEPAVGQRIQVALLLFNNSIHTSSTDKRQPLNRMPSALLLYKLLEI